MTSKKQFYHPLLLLTGLAYLAIAVPYGHCQSILPAGNAIESENGTGVSRTITTKKSFNQASAFFKSLGTNGRSCATCHTLTEGLNLSPEHAEQVFNETQGLDPLFATVDGTNAPNVDMSTLEARAAHTTMLRTKGLIRVQFHMPLNAQFSIEQAEDPYNFASTTDISCFRRPLPSTNLRFLSSVMWDGRESASEPSIRKALKSQIKDAVAGHMEGIAPPSESDINDIINFETSLYTTQIFDNNAGTLEGRMLRASPEHLSKIPFYIGINQILNILPRKTPGDKNVFTMFERWQRRIEQPTALQQAQLSVARGEKLFNSRRFIISDVPGLNDAFEQLPPRQRGRFVSFKKTTQLAGTCSSCHNTPMVGSNSLPLLMNTGTADGARRTPDLPLYTLKNNTSGLSITTTDPGAAMTSGKWHDIGKFKVPSLRGLETHSPYMHNGFSGDLLDIIEFYNRRFQIGLSGREQEDLKAFLQTL